jgi:hypothetical protein
MVPPLVVLPIVVPPSFLLRNRDRLLFILEVCSTHKDQVEIKCMCSVGGKTPIEPENYSFFSILRHGTIDAIYIVLL